jgi:copper chaperone
LKSVLKILEMHTLEDVNTIRQAIAGNEGVVACEVSAEKHEVSVVYDNYCLKLEKLVDSIEDLGYTVL